MARDLNGDHGEYQELGARIRKIILKFNKDNENN